MKKYHFIYRIVNQLNSKVYIGVHSTNKVDDGYMGSGSLLRKEIKEHGSINFIREIIEYFDNREEALQREGQLVNYDFIRRDDTYNLVLGGGKGIRTVAEKAIYFSKKLIKPIEYKAKEYPKLDENIKYVFKLKQPVKFHRSSNDIANMITDVIEGQIGKLLESLTVMYNNKDENLMALRYASKIMQYEGFGNNLYIQQERW